MINKDINQELIDCVHDILVQIQDIEPNDSEVLEIIHSIPNNILFIGLEWGYRDTEFGDKLYEWISNKNKVGITVNKYN